VTQNEPPKEKKKKKHKRNGENAQLVAEELKCLQNSVIGLSLLEEVVPDGREDASQVPVM